MRRRTAVSVVAVVAVIASGLWLIDQYILGHRCGSRLKSYEREAVLHELPPGGATIETIGVRPQCGLFPVSSRAEAHLASNGPMEQVRGWYLERFGDAYNLRPESRTPILGVETLLGRRDSGRHLVVIVRIGDASSAKRVYPYGAVVRLPPGAVSAIDVQVSEV